MRHHVPLQILGRWKRPVANATAERPKAWKNARQFFFNIIYSFAWLLPECEFICLLKWVPVAKFLSHNSQKNDFNSKWLFWCSWRLGNLENTLPQRWQIKGPSLSSMWLARCASKHPELGCVLNIMFIELWFYSFFTPILGNIASLSLFDLKLIFGSQALLRVIGRPLECESHLQRHKTTWKTDKK